MNLTELRNYVDEIESTPLDALMADASPAIRAALVKSLNRGELTREEGLALYTCR